MGKDSLLSAEISRARALAGGGAAPSDLAVALRSWKFQTPRRGPHRPSPGLLRWSDSLCAAIDTAVAQGAPLGSLLREVQPMVRSEEKLWSKIRGIERQFAFQAAIAVVLPWAVASLAGGVDLNLFTLAGAGFQALGLGCFCALFGAVTRRKADGRSWIFHFLVETWMRVVAGQALLRAIESSLGRDPVPAWRGWVEGVKAGTRDPIGVGLTREVSDVLLALLKNGSPAAEILADYIRRIDDERQAEFEEKANALPARLSLAFCAFFGPALFLLFLGALWPSLRSLGI